MSWAARLRHGGSIAARHARRAVNGRLVKMPMRHITDEFAFALHDQAWHPLTALLQDAGAGAVVAEAGQYRRFFESPRVRAVGTLNELLFLHTDHAGDGLPTFWLGTYPWGGLEDGDRTGTPFGWAFDDATGADTSALWGRHTTPWYRPGHAQTMTREIERTLDMQASVTALGYSPWRARGWPSVCVLERANGDRRGLVIDGHHRLVVLAHLGRPSVRVEVHRIVRECEIGEWSAVEDGRCTVAEAREFFDAFFELDGRERFAAAVHDAKREL